MINNHPSQGRYKSDQDRLTEELNPHQATRYFLQLVHSPMFTTRYGLSSVEQVTERGLCTGALSGRWVVAQNLTWDKYITSQI